MRGFLTRLSGFMAILILILTYGCTSHPMIDQTGLDHDLGDDGLANNSITCSVSGTPVPHDLDFDGIVKFCHDEYCKLPRSKR